MSEDPKRARDAARRDLDRLIDMINATPGADAVGYNADGVGALPSDIAPDGDHAVVHLIIGSRGRLTRDAAKDAANVWHQITTKYPKACFCIELAGYDDDPRELWELADVARYVRRWAILAGIRSLADVPNREWAQESRMLGFLGACGVFGEAMKQKVIANYRRDHGQVTAH
jgi:hypothetical protein